MPLNFDCSRARLAVTGKFDYSRVWQKVLIAYCLYTTILFFRLTNTIHVLCRWIHHLAEPKNRTIHYIQLCWEQWRRLSNHVYWWGQKINGVWLWCCKYWLLLLSLLILSRGMGFPSMWYVRSAKPQISLRIRAVWSEHLLVAWTFLRNSKWCSVISLTVIEYSRLSSDWAYAQAGLSICYSHIPRCWKSHVVSQL